MKKYLRQQNFYDQAKHKFCEYHNMTVDIFQLIDCSNHGKLFESQYSLK